MGVSTLSFEQIELLKSSPYVASVTVRQVSFTAEFKQRFYEEYTKGKSPKEILREMGINPETLGESRIVSIRMHAVQQGKSGHGFTDRKVQWSPSAIYGRAKTTEEKLARLEHELAYTRQELEFVEKSYRQIDMLPPE
ncbi:HTH domain-containing protein [Desulfosporosinus sp. Sb-LF]|uniref:HTH domain-containing protein n=1 Tax=Desulfosporosinus sp. Sb-LF TaxID=2560027 RepID=UPI00107F3288|nr:HTH domain-containing protein [Desulfosporosinus sp. Sb-LF]TGE33880.1 hypothetical protein E4K68_03455 [Desulfosporosinus sp. Sb-LF]